MRFKRMKRSRLDWKWMREHPVLARLYALLAIFWGPIVIFFAILWEGRHDLIEFYEDVIGVIFMEDDLDD